VVKTPGAKLLLAQQQFLVLENGLTPGFLQRREL
jgi:hypothetical protein